MQAQLADNTQGPRRRRRRARPREHLLEGLLHTERGTRFIVSSANKGARRYRYYVEQQETKPDGTLPPLRLPAGEIEAAVVTGLRSLLADHRGLLFRLGAENPSEAPVALRSLSTLSQALGGRIGPELEASIRLMLGRVVVGHNRLQLVFNEAGLRNVLGIPRGGSSNDWPANASETEFTLTVPFTAARRGRQMKLVLPDATTEDSVDRSLVTAIVRAWDWAGRLLSGEVATMAEICAAEGFTDAYVSQLLPLAFLAPEIVEQILAGQQPPGLTANRLIWGERLPVRWEEQKGDAQAILRVSPK